MSTASILTYNLLFGRAFNELVSLVKQHKPDIICIQEFEAKDESIMLLEELGYTLADYSHSFFKYFKFYGVANFYKATELEHKAGEAINLARSFYESILFVLRLGRCRRSVIHSYFATRTSKKTLSIYNVHLTPFLFYGTNRVREKQIEATMEHVEENSKAPTVVIGDFNYPYRRKNLETLFERYDFREATNNLLFTFESVYFWLLRIKLKTDYILYKNTKHISTQRINKSQSDHFPILAQFEL